MNNGRLRKSKLSLKNAEDNKMPELTEAQVEGLIIEHIELGAQIKELKKKQDAAKEQFTAWLDDRGAKKVTTKDFVATLSKRTGSFDKKAFQIEHKIPDSEMAKFKKADSVFWTVKKK